MSSEWTVWVMYGDGRSVVESAAGELEAFSRRGELEAERGTAYGAACLPPGSADLAVLFGRRLGTALAGQVVVPEPLPALGQVVDTFGDSGVA